VCVFVGPQSATYRHGDGHRYLNRCWHRPGGLHAQNRALVERLAQQLQAQWHTKVVFWSPQAKLLCRVLFNDSGLSCLLSRCHRCGEDG
jgi:hypothetical protein